MNGSVGHWTGNVLIYARTHQTAYVCQIRGADQIAMSESLLDRCLAKNIRMTSQRQVIIKVIEESDDHPDVDQLYLRSVQIDNTISIATVYRTVKLLEEAGLIERLEFGDGRSRYEEAGEHHEHLVDVETGEVFEFYNEELEALKEEIARKMGYDLIDHRLELYGKKIKE